MQSLPGTLHHGLHWRERLGVPEDGGTWSYNQARRHMEEGVSGVERLDDPKPSPHSVKEEACVLPVIPGLRTWALWVIGVPEAMQAGGAYNMLVVFEVRFWASVLNRRVFTAIEGAYGPVRPTQPEAYD